jgi:hypothetical protein
MSFIYGTKKNGEVEKVPRSRKAYKVMDREDRLYQTHDFAIIKKKLQGTKPGEMVYIPKEVAGEYRLNYPSLAGYYSVNSKGPVKLTGDLLEQAKKANYKQGAA